MNVNITITNDDDANADPFSVEMITVDHVVECEGEDHDIPVGDVAFRDTADCYVCVTHFATQIVAVFA